MKSIEISARTVAEAVELALAQLGKDRDEVAIAVLDAGESGDEALVRVTVVDDDEETSPAPVTTTAASGGTEVQEIARTILEDLLERMDIHAYVTPVVTRVPGQKGDVEETITLHV
jgi:spoIIIJ-associated protein